MAPCTPWTRRWWLEARWTRTGRTFEGFSPQTASAPLCPSSRDSAATTTKPSRPATWTSRTLGPWWGPIAGWRTAALATPRPSAPSSWRRATSCWQRTRRRPSRPWRLSRRRRRRYCPASPTLPTPPSYRLQATGWSATASGTCCSKRCSTWETFYSLNTGGNV